MEPQWTASACGETPSLCSCAAGGHALLHWSPMGAWHGFCSQPATRHNVNAGRAFAFNRLQSALSSHLCSPPQRFDCRAQNNVDRLGILPRCYEIRERSPLSLQIGDSMDGQSRKCGCPCTRRHKRRQIKLAIESVSASSAKMWRFARGGRSTIQWRTTDSNLEAACRSGRGQDGMGVAQNIS